MCELGDLEMYREETDWEILKLAKYVVTVKFGTDLVHFNLKILHF